jgi:hypothetical protein
MAAFFLLMSTYVAPDECNRDEFFAEMAYPIRKDLRREVEVLVGIG